MRIEPYNITFLNHLGGFEYFWFTASKEFSVIIEEAGEMTQNIMSDWPNSYGINADTILKQTYRKSRNEITIRSQYLSLAQLQALKEIRTSPLVQIVYSRVNRRTILVDSDSFRVYDEKDKTFTISFRARFTDNIPSQRL